MPTVHVQSGPLDPALKTCLSCTPTRTAQERGPERLPPPVGPHPGESSGSRLCAMRHRRYKSASLKNEHTTPVAEHTQTQAPHGVHQWIISARATLAVAQLQVVDKEDKPAMPGDLLVVEICNLGPLEGYE